MSKKFNHAVATRQMGKSGVGFTSIIEKCFTESVEQKKHQKILTKFIDKISNADLSQKTIVCFFVGWLESEGYEIRRKK